MTVSKKLDTLFTQAGLHKLSAKNIVNDVRLLEERVTHLEEELRQARDTLQAIGKNMLPPEARREPITASQMIVKVKNQSVVTEKDFVKKFRAEVEAQPDRGRGKRFPKHLQRQAVEYYHYRHARDGAMLAPIAKELGLPHPTLRRWTLDAPTPGHFDVHEEPLHPPPTPPPAAPRPVVPPPAVAAKSTGNMIDVNQLAHLLMSLTQRNTD